MSSLLKSQRHFWRQAVDCYSYLSRLHYWSDACDSVWRAGSFSVWRGLAAAGGDDLGGMGWFHHWASCRADHGTALDELGIAECSKCVSWRALGLADDRVSLGMAAQPIRC